jgi:hypothetical protein
MELIIYIYIYTRIYIHFFFCSEISEKIKSDVATSHIFDGKIPRTEHGIISVVEIFCQ